MFVWNVERKNFVRSCSFVFYKLIDVPVPWSAGTGTDTLTPTTCHMAWIETGFMPDRSNHFSCQVCLKNRPYETYETSPIQARVLGRERERESPRSCSPSSMAQCTACTQRNGSMNKI
jgi:hypothetical protein